MRPFFRPGDEVFFRVLAAAEARQGDIILYRRSRQIVMHRLLKVNLDDQGYPQYYLKGDALEVEDRPVSGKMILGKVVARKRGKRIRKLEGWIPCLAGALAAWVSPYSRWISLFRRLARRLSSYLVLKKKLSFR